MTWYVDGIEQGAGAVQDYKASVRVHTQANLTATRTGNILLADANGALGTLDGVTMAVGDRVLIGNNQTTGADRGIYVIDSLGSAGSKYQFTRAVDFDSDAEVTSGTIVPVTAGTVDSGRAFVLTTADPITVNTTSLTFTYWNLPAGTNGGVLAYASSKWATTAAGTAGQPLVSNGSSAPTYQSVIGVAAAQMSYQGGAWLARSDYAAHSTRTSDVSDYLVTVSDVSGAVIIQLVACGSTASKAAFVTVRNIAYATTNTITIKPPSGKKLDNTTDGTYVINTSNGSWTGFEDENGHWHSLGI